MNKKEEEKSGSADQRISELGTHNPPIQNPELVASATNPSKIQNPDDLVDAALRHKVAKINPSPSFVGRLAAQLRAMYAARTERSRVRIPIWGWLGAAVAVLLVVMLVIRSLLPHSSIPVAPTGEGTPITLKSTEEMAPATRITADAGTPASAATNIPPSLPPTPEPEPDFAESLPPAVVAAIPRSGAEVNTKAGVLIRFSRPMDRASVEQALRVSAEGAGPMEGDFTWEDDQVVTFRPKGLASGVRYNVSIGTEARANNGLPLNGELSFAFSTVGPLTVTHVSPANGASELRGDTPIIIAFNYPIVPINCSGQIAETGGECPALELDIQPAVVGQGMWVNTSVYRFDPLPSWDSGVTYSVTVPAGIAGVDGAEMAAPVSFGFSTAAPEIQRILVDDVNGTVPLETGVRVKFNTPMEHTSSEAAFTLTDSQGNVVPGAFTWEDDGMTMVFTPTHYLAIETRYTALMDKSATTVSGVSPEFEAQIDFTTTPPIQVNAITSDSGDDQLAYYAGLQVRFSGMVDPQSLSDHIQITHNGELVDDVTVSWEDYDVKWPFAFVHWEKSAGAEYCLHVLPGVSDRYGNMISEEVTKCFVTTDISPIFGPMKRYDSTTLDAAEAARLYFMAVNVPQTTLRLSNTAPQDFTKYADTTSIPGTSREWTLYPNSERNQSQLVAVDLNNVAPLPTGLYLLTWTIPGSESWETPSTRFAVVDRHLTLKMSDDEVLIWVTDLRSGTPIAGADVYLIDDQGNRLGQSVTDGDGIARFPIAERADRWPNCLAISGVAGQPGFGVARSDWNMNASPWEFDISYNFDATSEYAGYIQTDRPIYRPGQELYFHGILRNADDGQYSLPPSDLKLSVRLYLGDYSVPEIILTPSSLGTVDGSFHIPDDAPLGSYSIIMDVVREQKDYNSWSANFSVAAYRKPEFEVTVTPEQDHVIGGATLRALVEARYYAGSAASNARIHWRVLAKPYLFSPSVDANVTGWWSWNLDIPGWDFWLDPEVIAEGDAVADAAGKALLELPANLNPLANQKTVGPQNWEVEATVTDESNFAITGRGNATVHAGRFYVGLKPRDWVVGTGSPTTVDVLTLDWHSQPVPNQPVTLKLAQRSWSYAQPKIPYGEGEWTYTDTVVATQTVTTDNAGKAEATFIPNTSGSYVILADGIDADGHSNHGETGLWVGGNEIAEWKLPENQVTPIADAQSYRSGDTAKILLPTPFAAPYEVLMTVERENFMEVRRFTATETNPLIEVPITDAHVPNIIVSFVAVKGVDPTKEGSTPDIRIGMVELEVEPVKQQLTIQITPDCPDAAVSQSLTPPISCAYMPGDAANLTIRATDYTGAPVDAEVTLAVVDKAVLALAYDTTRTLMDAFYSPHPLRITTGDGLMVLNNRFASDMEKLQEELERTMKERLAGGIGGGGRADFNELDVRQDFPDTALWEATLRTGASGETNVALKLPDSLTTWVADARAATADTLVGQAKAEFVVTKPLIVRPVTPRFFTDGDQSEVAAIVQNNTGADLEVVVRLETNLQIANQQTADQRISVPAGGRARVSWPVEVSDVGSDFAELTFIAEGGGYRDAARPSVGRASDHALPIYRYESPDVMRAVGTLTDAGSRIEAIVVPPDAGPDSTLTVRVSPSLAAGMTGGLTYLEHFEYECNEQLVSRFLPNVVTYRALRDLGQNDPALESKLQALVDEALKKLYARQNFDGGWGWWKEESKPQTSAYAVLGMVQAQRAGFPVDEDNLNRALGYLFRTLATRSAQAKPLMTDTFALYVLAEAGETLPEGVDVEIFDNRDQLDVAGRAYLALALGVVAPDDPRVTTLLEELRADAVISASGAHWEQADSEYWVTWTRATAVVIDALARFAPDDPLLPQAVRWLMAAREKDRWETTQETAWAILALTDYMTVTGELSAGYAWGLALNTATLEQGQASPETLRQTVERIIPVSDMLREWPNSLEISRGEGNGVLYYTADLAVYLPAEQLEAESDGFTVDRQYCVPVRSADNRPSWYGSQEDFGECAPVTSVHPGDLVEVRLTLTVPHYRDYVQLEDTYPAGMEPVDATLKTEQSDLTPEVSMTGPQHPWWWQTFDHEELRDERAVFFAINLAPGVYQARYYLRAAIPGTYKVLPAIVSEMYFPDVRGRSDGEVFVIEP
ncbi:MAG: Ig-like domain-containing protein [Anaerolineae bacterium]|nr:Ig-like domain-containing protein [Anaerolineae bacterium]